ncbi:Vegetative incompatibility protein HET-E-1 [Ceratobasidium theobromae]|uniref:Vegetative incompatibility protein HET-E-1 n=1 Tax=Ceratobasidium theobromae TaxID=1582974 RepID=A0A5N5QEB9_9AGAM|nr:Vegetative incompatibility protein HET-E-1 [Ceratobasidium theobromae]
MSDPKRGFRDSLSRKFDKLLRTPSPAPPRSTLSTNNLTSVQAPSSSSNLLLPPSPGRALPVLATHTPPPAEPSPPTSPARSLDLTSSPAWTRLRTTLRSLHKYTSVFPPLQSAIGSVISGIDVMKLALEHPDDYGDVASRLKLLAEDLIRYFQESKSVQMSEFIERIAMVIEEEAKQINRKQDHETGSDFTGANHDIEELAGRYQRIEGLFRQLQVNATLSWNIAGDQSAHSRLEEMTPSKLASCDSPLSTNTKQQTCTKDTQMAILLELNTWSCDPNAPNIYWMSGMPGTGNLRTSLVRKFCETLKKQKLLGASFFCNRITAKCRDVERIIPTIAYQLAGYSLPFRSVVCRVLGNDPDIGTRKISTQFEHLLRVPILKVKDAVPENLVVVIDALEECSDWNGARSILEMLIQRGTDLPLKFFVTSQPEPGIWQTMQSRSFGIRPVFILHEIERSLVQADIGLYLAEELEFISPSNTQVQKLTELSGSLFIYATTAVRYIRAGGSLSISSGRLSIILEANSDSDKKPGEIDKLYTIILTAALEEGLENEDKDPIRLVLWTALCAREPVSVETLTALGGLSNSSLALAALQPLHPVIYVSENGSIVTTFHPSFPDFMFDQARQSRFSCDRPKHKEFLARRCFELMNEQLRFNICNLESSFVRDKDVKDLDERVKQFISPTLSYACRYWSEHLRQVTVPEELFPYINEFLSERLLFWMEVMNLKGWMKIAIKMLHTANGWLVAFYAPRNLVTYIKDSIKFVARFTANAVSESTPHIYVSLLPFCHQSSSVFKNFWKRTRGLAAARPKIIEQRLAIWNTGQAANSIAFSSDGTRLAFGTDDGTVTVKDVIDGSLVVGPLKGHEQWVLSVAFSPDGKSIASGSGDSTILVWNANNGMRLAGPFRGHTDAVKSVTFSPDSTRIISGSWDHSVRVWGVQGGIPILAPFLGHTKAVNSVAVSPDGTHIISGSDDRTIQIWDADQGTCTISPLIGHSDSVTSVAFSPNGTRIISGSKDCTILIWDALNGAHVSTPLADHSNPVRSVAFSPNGRYIVSSSDDTTVRVWSAVDGTLVSNPLKGHTKRVWSVAFSPDSARIASSGDDCTIYIWNAFANNSSSLQSGHTSDILSVAFSPDGTQIVSGSADRSICTWGANDGSLIAGPMVGHTGIVISVGISPNGTHIASGSSDHTIIIWDALDGSHIAGPLRGHTNYVTSVCFSPDGTRIVSGSWDKTLCVWSTHNYALIDNPFEGHTGGINSVAFSPSGAYIASGSDDNTIIIWDAFKGTLFAGPLKGHTNWVLSVAFSPNGTHIVSGAGDRTIRVWSASNGNHIAGPFNVHTRWIRSVAYSPDGTRIVSGSDDHTVVVCNANNGAIVSGPFQGHTNHVYSVAFSPDGMSVVSGSLDRTIRIWNIHGNMSSPHPTQHDPSSTDKLLPATQITANNDGWVTNPNSDLLVWVPPEVDRYLPPHTTLLIRPQGSTSIDHKERLLGDDWRQCYRS